MKSYYRGSIWRRKTKWESISFVLPRVQYFLCKCRIYLSKGTILRVQRVKNRSPQVHLTDKRNNFCLYFVPRLPQVSSRKNDSNNFQLRCWDSCLCPWLLSVQHSSRLQDCFWEEVLRAPDVFSQMLSYIMCCLPEEFLPCSPPREFSLGFQENPVSLSTELSVFSSYCWNLP